MAANRFLAVWLRRFAGLLVLLGVLTLSACGGGSGAPNNPFTPTPPPAATLTILPVAATVYPGVPSTLTINGGTAPYRVLSSNTTLLPVASATNGSTISLLAASVSADTKVTVTVLDANNQTASADVTISPTPPGAPLSVNPSTATLYSGQPTILTIAGGVAPYHAFSANSALLPVTANVSGNTIALLPSAVGADTTVVVTVTDAGGASQQATLVVKPASLLNTFAVTPNLSDCGTNAICSGQTGTAAVKVLGPTGAPAPGRQVRFEVVQGPFSIRTTDPNVPAASSQTVVSDASGVAQVIVQANVNAPTQPAQIRATDMQSGQQLTTGFIIQQNTNGSSILTVVPSTATIQGTFKGICPSGARVDYFIYGGTPPYRVTASFPDAVTIINGTVNTSGGSFEAITTGMCVDPLTFSIFDATGRQTTAQLSNKEGTNDLPTAPAAPALAMTPADVKAPSCAVKTTYRFAVTGGTQPYSVFVSAPGSATVEPVSGSAGLYDVKFETVFSGTMNVNAIDGSSPQKTVTSTITCP